MKQYDSYKDSGVQWIGKIPSHWDIVKLKFCCGPLKSGGTPKSDNERLYSSEGTPWVAISDMSSTNFVYDTEKHLTQEGIDDKRLMVFPVGTILYSIYATLGKVSELKVPACINQAILAISPKRGYDTIYFKYCLQAQEQYVFSLSNGNTQNNLNAEKVANFMLVIPPLDEQRYTASYLDKKCEEIDKAIATQQKRIDLLGELRQNIITHAVTRGINPDALLKDSGVEWIGKVPEHWDIVPLKRVSTIILGKMLSTIESDTYEYLCAKDVHFGSVDISDLKEMNFTETERKLYEVKFGDMLIVEGGAGAGGCAIYQHQKEGIYIQNSLMIVRGNAYMNTEYICYYVQSINTRGYVGYICNTATIPHFSKEKVGMIPLPIPPREEQGKIVEYISQKTKDIDISIAKAERQISLLQELKQSIITEVVTGKRKVFA